MRQGKTLPDLAAELQRQMQTKADYVADTTRVNFTSGTDGSVVTIDLPGSGAGVEDFKVTDHAHGQIAERLGIPKKYYDRMRTASPHLLDENVRHWFYREPERRMFRTLDGRCRAVLSDRFNRIDNYDIAEVVLPELQRIPGMQIVSCDLTERHMYIKTTFPFEVPLDRPRKVGDRLRAGLIVKNSEVGLGRFLVAPYVVVLSCKNGMTFTEHGEARVHLGARQDEGYVNYADDTVAAQDEAFKLGVRDIVRQVADEESFKALTAQFKDLPEFQVEGHAPGVVEKLGQKHDLTEGEQKSVLSHLIEGGDLSAWGYVQAVTRTAEDADDYDRASDLEALGGKLALQSTDEWESLAKVAA